MSVRVLNVTVQLAGADFGCGRLLTKVCRGRESASFTYDHSYLTRPDAFALSPDLPLGEAAIRTTGCPLFLAFVDCIPDRWGRDLLLRAERDRARDEARHPRTLFEGDRLAGVNDAFRQGAIRVWKEGDVVAQDGKGTPAIAEIPHLLAQSDLATDNMDADVRDLLRVGSSLGGARPKASVADADGTLYVAKFPKADEDRIEDVCAGKAWRLSLHGATASACRPRDS